MPKAVFDQLNYSVLTPTPMQLQLADSSVRHPEGIDEDVPVRMRDCFVPVDFVVLDMDNQKDTTLILGWPFLNIADANIDVGAREIRLHINGKEEKFDFRPKKERLLVLCNVPNKICKRTDTAIAFTQKYSRVSYPLRNVSTLSMGSGSSKDTHWCTRDRTERTS
jgi:hypothetical protein